MCCQSVSVMLVFIIHQKVSRQWYVMWLTLTHPSLFSCSSAMLPDPHGIPFLSAKTMWLDCKSLAHSVGIQVKGSVLGLQPKMPHNANPNCAARGFMLLYWPCWSYPHFMPSALHLNLESVLKLRLKPEQSHTLTLYNTNYNSKFLNTSLQTTFITLILCSWLSGKRTLMFLGWVQHERATYSCPWENTGLLKLRPTCLTVCPWALLIVTA